MNYWLKHRASITHTSRKSHWKHQKKIVVSAPRRKVIACNGLSSHPPRKKNNYILAFYQGINKINVGEQVSASSSYDFDYPPRAFVIDVLMSYLPSMNTSF